MKHQIKRRCFVSQCLGATLGLVGLRNFSLAQTDPIKKPLSQRIGLQLYSVREACSKDFFGTIQSVAEMGYQAVEFAGYYGQSAADVRAFLNDHNLQCCGSHVAYDLLTKEHRSATIEYNAELENPYLIIPWLDEKHRQTLDGWRQFADFLNQLSDELSPYKMQVGYHNHSFEFSEMEGAIPWEVLFQNTQPEVIMQLDMGNAMHGQADPVEYLKMFPGRATTVHLKEYAHNSPPPLIGNGEVAWKEVLQLCQTTAGTQWLIVEEENSGRDPMESVKTCLSNLQAML